MNKYSLIKHFWISCAHSIAGAGKCENVHGHNYKISFCLSGEKLDKQGMLIDFRKIKKNIEKKFDHQLLNNFNEFSEVPPSTEYFTAVIYHTIKKLCEEQENQPKVVWVEIEETNEVIARYEEH